MNDLVKKIDKKLRQYSRIPRIWTKYHLDKTNNTKRYIFHHMPKCAGTSTVDAFTNWFVVLKDYPMGWSRVDNPDSYLNY